MDNETRMVPWGGDEDDGWDGVVATEPATSPIDMSHANAAIMKAIAKAQEQAQTVGKDGRNEYSRYNYATAEAMIRAGRDARKGTGLSLICTTTIANAPPHKGDAKQWVCATITTTWVLMHEGGGWIRGRAEMDAIADGRRPNDKAVAACETFLRGFIERDLFALDRAEEEKDAVDKREDDGYQPSRGADRRPPKSSGADDLAKLKAAVKIKYEQLGGKTFMPWADVLGGAGAGPQQNFENLRKVDKWLKDVLAQGRPGDAA